MGPKRTWKGEHLFLYIACLVIILSGSQGCVYVAEKRQDSQSPADTKDTMDKEGEKAPLKDIKDVLNLFPQFAKKWQGKQDLAKARALMLNGYYDLSLKNNEEVLGLYPRTLGDQALFQMGLNYAHPSNPNQDYQKSIECFQSIINEYPESNIRDDAGFCVLFLQEIVEKNNEITIKDKKINTLQRLFTKKRKVHKGLAKAKALMLNGHYELSLRNSEEVLGLYPKTLGDQALFQMGLSHAHPENPDQDYQKSMECFKGIIKNYPKSKVRYEAGLWVLLLRGILAKDNTIINKDNTIINKDENINNLHLQIEDLKQQIESLKDIDLRIEEKKRSTLLK